MRLVFVITATGIGGAEMMLHKLLKGLSAEFEPHVVSMRPVGKIGERIRALGIPVESLEMRRGIPDPLALVQLIRYLQRRKPDVVHTWMYHADLMGGVAARCAGISAVAWAIRQSNLAPGNNNKMTLAVIRLGALLSRRVPARIVCCSEAARTVHIAYGYAPEQMVVIPNGFDLSHFKPDPEARCSVRAELGLSLETPLVGLVGRWDRQKNHAGFLDAAAAVRRSRPDTHFLLAGEGIDAGNHTIRRIVASHGLTSAVHLLGLRDDIPRLMAALDVLASSSYGEAFPNVLGEAMASGVPCAVTDVGDSAYIVGTTGRVVPPENMRALSSAIESLLGMRAEELNNLRERARARITEEFEISTVVRRYERLYRELFDERRRNRRLH